MCIEKKISKFKQPRAHSLQGKSQIKFPNTLNCRTLIYKKKASFFDEFQLFFIDFLLKINIVGV